MRSNLFHKILLFVFCVLANICFSQKIPKGRYEYVKLVGCWYSNIVRVNAIEFGADKTFKLYYYSWNDSIKKENKFNGNWKLENDTIRLIPLVKNDSIAELSCIIHKNVLNISPSKSGYMEFCPMEKYRKLNISFYSLFPFVNIYIKRKDNYWN